MTLITARTPGGAGAASILLPDGVSIAELAVYLGHHDPGFTLRTYVHLMPDAADRMRSVVDRALSLGLTAQARPSRRPNER
jgi:hypothetical protein